ncbi:hypothetical protein J116_010010 [Streptomyces thermolilacinus SPC6]|uniref:Uncharacterized protein n=1 Tax=Streptomyces thermolilacinus SPC6 TaxID=1306406 RepID=A0A1D3DR20_9ACTN|nr:hypothetical protein J116_010010 [Streptomyces thermolilacinus SPC6]
MPLAPTPSPRHRWLGHAAPGLQVAAGQERPAPLTGPVRHDPREATGPREGPPFTTPTATRRPRRASALRFPRSGLPEWPGGFAGAGGHAV